MTRCFIALGSNLDDPLAQVSQALASLSLLPESTIGQRSRWYQSAAIGPGNQQDYINGAVELFTKLSPLALLDAMQAIENQQGRVRTTRWGARTLDLDLLLYGDQVISHPRLSVPHPHMMERNFVLQPLLDIDPALIFPDGSIIQQRLEACPSNTLTPIEVAPENNNRSHS